MPDGTVRNRRVLVAEDEFMLADELQFELEDAGATVLGPAGALADAIALIKAEKHIDEAILDANLGGDMVFPAADLLIERGVPIVFTTGYHPSIIPARFNTMPLVEKPINIRRVFAAIGQAMHG
jgi:DNA-binding response OmpR family regulator